MTSKKFEIVIAGNANCGKTALFNCLTGSRHKVANYPGVTVESREASLLIPPLNIKAIDLPGVYSLRGNSPDELVTRQILLGELPSQTKPSLVVFVADATNLALNLRLALEIKALGYPMIIALNMMDIAQKHGMTIDVKQLSALLGIPVVPTIATKKEGITELKEQIKISLMTLNPAQAAQTFNWQDPTTDDLRKTYAKVHSILERCVTESTKLHNRTEKLDRFFLHPFFGTATLLIILFTMFQAVFSWAKSLQDFLQDKIDWTVQWCNHILPVGPLANLLTDGVLAGVGSVVVFLPQILCLYFFILLLEDSGYMARAAFLMDRLMAKVGLNGKAFIPLLSSYACAVPGIMSTRTIENLQDRMVTILIAPLTTCSARLPVYTLIIAALIPSKTVLGIFNLQGLVMFGLYLVGITAALGMGYIFKRFFFKSKPPIMLMELPLYHLPHLKNVLLALSQRAKVFLTRAGTLILAVMIILWFVTTYPEAPLHATMPAVSYSWAGRVGHFLEPFFAPLGFSWQMVIALIPGLAAREAAIAALGTVYAVSGDADTLTAGLIHTLQHQWSLATGLSILAWYVFAPQCISTLAITKRETNSWIWPIVMFSYMFLLAYIAAFSVFHITQWILH